MLCGRSRRDEKWRWRIELYLIAYIMPTVGRRRFVPQAIGYFLYQDYENTDERRAIWQRHLLVNHKLGAIDLLRLQ